MSEQEALELIDAHLDDDQLTDQQVEELAAWLKANPQHAQRAFHRIFLHSFLRRRLQAQRLPVLSLVRQAAGEIESELTELDVRGSVAGDPPTELLIPPAPTVIVPERKARRPRRMLLAGGIIFLAAAVAAFSLRYSGVLSSAVADTYDGFAYPATSIPAPAADSQTWPTTGGLQGLGGGAGWSEPWQESGPKVAVVVDHARETKWDPKDMRKFKPLGHTDAEGRTLQTTGLQMRTAMGPRSVTSRKLDLEVFPESMREKGGLGRDGAVIWFSFLAQSFSGTVEHSRTTYLQLGSRGVSGFRIGKVSAAPSGNWSAMGLLTGGQVNLRSSTVPSGEMVFVVTRLEFREGPEEAAVWINPGLGGEPKVAAATMQLSVPDFRFDGVTINANYSTDIDEIRFGRSFRAVAPVR